MEETESSHALKKRIFGLFIVSTILILLALFVYLLYLKYPKVKDCIESTKVFAWVNKESVRVTQVRAAGELRATMD